MPEAVGGFNAIKPQWAVDGSWYSQAKMRGKNNFATRECIAARKLWRAVIKRYAHGDPRGIDKILRSVELQGYAANTRKHIRKRGRN
jgi:hypothetical protein